MELKKSIDVGVLCVRIVLQKTLPVKCKRLLTLCVLDIYIGEQEDTANIELFHESEKYNFV